MPDDNTPFAENNELDDTFEQHLRYLYNTKLDDRQSLTHIRERLLKKSQESLPAYDWVSDTAISSQERWLPPEPVFSRAHPGWRKSLSWSQRATQLVAILLIVVITGAFVLVLTLSHTSSEANISLRPGWEQIAVYSGKGNETITNLHRSLPQIWASSIICTGNTAITFKLLGKSIIEELGADSCQDPESTLSQPTTFSYNESPTMAIQTIQVIAQADTSWQLHLLQAINQPNFQLGSEWMPTGFSSSGNGISFTRNSQDDKWVRQSTQKTYEMQISAGSAQSWALLTICFGNGESQLQLSPDVRPIAMPRCNGQPQLTVLHFPTTTTLSMLTVSTRGDLMWSAQIASCKDEAKCQRAPGLQVTPQSTAQP